MRAVRRFLRSKASLCVYSALLVVATGCDPVIVANEAGTYLVVSQPADTIPAPGPSPQARIVCDPFANNPNHPGTDIQLGILGKMFYLTEDDPRYKSTAEYFQNGVAVDASLYFSQIFIPTRKFDVGFVTDTGELILNHRGEALYEYFGMQLETELKLTDADRPGPYQFALLADDGAILQMNRDGTWETVVDDDGEHPTRMECSKAPIWMDHSTRVPAKVDYFQGPKYHVALVMLWREWGESSSFDPDDSACSRYGNSFFFDYTKAPSGPKKNFLDMLARGWKVVPPENFALPSQVTKNPCNDPNKPEEPVRTLLTSTDPSSPLTNQTSARFTFGSNYGEATFECSLDGAVPSKCSKAAEYSNLSHGPHTFAVWATSPSGVRDEVGASYSWTIDVHAPYVTTVNYVRTQTTIAINWTTNEPTTTKLLWGKTIDVPNVIPEDDVLKTSHSVVLSGLTPGTVYMFHMAGKDEAGNNFISSRYGTVTLR